MAEGKRALVTGARGFIGSHPARCSRCVLPETVPGISFDPVGVCSFCHAYRPPDLLGEERLLALFEHAKDLKRRYDCVVPISGGRDSTYVLYLARAVYGLRVLAVNYDGEFRRPIAMENMLNACDRLGVELRCVRSKWSLASRHVRCTIKAASSPRHLGFCGACGYGNKAAALRAALEHEVPLVLWGSSSVEVTTHMMRRVWAALPAGPGRYVRLLKPSFWLARLYLALQRMEFPVPGSSVLRNGDPVLRDGRVSLVPIFDYVRWDRREIKETIKSQLAWRKPPELVSTWRIDCKLHELVNFEFFTLFGCSKDAFGYCSMINAGQMDRSEALAQEEAMAARCMDPLPELLKNEVGLSRRQAERVLSLAPARR